MKLSSYGKLSSFIFLLLCSTACARSQPSSVEFSLQVKPASRAGVYRVTGTTSLPDQSQISVMGIRDLHPSHDAVQPDQLAAHSNYSILARRIATVSQGKWETELSLWQVASNGDYQEAWQLNQPNFKLPITPAEEVSFVAIAELNNQPPSVSQQLSRERYEKIDSSLIRSTAQGERYLQTNQTLPVNLPTAKTTPPIQTAAERNGGWGDRTSLKAETPAGSYSGSPRFKGNLTEAPPSSTEFMR
ncbi:MAG: hypothetical protein HC866_12590 [Leptolyngbyaceae cyanobacterium RU_5_1]|nr:hypothetical protein [Leptolyngbyaceae cyanobacterium RU_5_1]